MSTKREYKREYPFFSAVLDLMAIHSKKVSLIGTAITSALISLYHGHAPFQFLFADYDILMTLLITYAGTAICYYSIIHLIDYIRQISMNTGLHNRALRKGTAAMLILQLSEYFRSDGGAVQAYIEYGVNPTFAWSYHGAGVAVLSALLIYAYVDDKIKEATGG